MNEVQQVYLDKNILFVSGDMGEKTLSYIQEAIGAIITRVIKASGKAIFPDLTLIIETHGGGSSHEIYDVLEAYPGKITGIVLNYAQSAGGIILQACDMRYATPGSRIMIHHGQTPGVKIDMLMCEDKAKLNTFLEFWRNLMEMKYKIISKRTGKSRDEVQKLCFEDRDMLPDEAIKFGLLDAVWEGPLPISEVGMVWPKKE